MVEPNRKTIKIFFEERPEERPIQRRISSTIPISELITQAKSWFNLQNSSSELILELEGNNLDREKLATGYPNLFTQVIKLRVFQPTVLKTVAVTINGSQEKEIAVDIGLSLSELTKKVFDEWPADYIIRIDSRMISPKTIIKDLPNLEDIVIDFVTENVAKIAAIVKDDHFGNIEEDYSVDILTTVDNVKDYILRTKNLDPNLYIPMIDCKVIEGSQILKEIPDLSAVIVEFQKVEDSFRSEKKELQQDKIEEQKKNHESNPQEIKNGNSVPIKSSLIDRGMFGGQYLFNIRAKPSVIVEYMKDTFEFALEQDSTYESFQKAITESTGLSAKKQLLILVHKEDYKNLITKDCKKLLELINF